MTRVQSPQYIEGVVAGGSQVTKSDLDEFKEGFEAGSNKSPAPGKAKPPKN